MKHLEIEQLRKYGTRRLNTGEMMQAVLHLDGCAACSDLFQTMFPTLSDTKREISLDVLTTGETEVFHLDYDEHLRPFVDGEADEAMREIVESHLKNCAFCARAVSDLREFSDTWQRRENERNKVGDADFDGAANYNSLRSATGNHRLLSVSAIAVLMLAIGGWMIWRQSETTDFIAESRMPPDAPPIAATENPLSRLPENSTANREVKPPTVPSENDSANKIKNTGGDKSRKSNKTAAELFLAALPPDFRVRFQKAVQTQKITLPAFIADLRQEINLRGAAESGKSTIISPNAQAERSLRPTFKWRSFAASGANYVVTIYDESYNQIAVSPKLTNSKWRLDVPLERGKIYRWQVKSENSAESHAAPFKVLGEDAAARLKKIENAAPHSPLARGIGYASEGLLDEAAREFQKEKIKNERGDLAGKLHDSIRKRR